MIVVNGKEYKFWGQFVERKVEWVGGILRDDGDPMDRRMGHTTSDTKIVDIRLEPNGKDAAMFLVEGEDFTCGFDVSVGGITGGPDDWLSFSGYGGHTWQIQKAKVTDGTKAN